MNDTSLLLSIGKVAELLGVHIDTVREWNKLGKLTSIKTLGGHRRFLLVDVNRLLRKEAPVEENLMIFRQKHTFQSMTKMLLVGLYNVINSSQWKGCEPETCKVLEVQLNQPVPMNEEATFTFIVSHRPKGYITYHKGGFWWDGWKLKHIDVTQEGVLLDGKGNPLPEGEEPIILEWNMYKSVDFNSFDFGEQIK
ncbi:MAG: helix-turn-helix domain-containing protein [Candidatus Doudnabacteria bacterium]|nr:helix-turn-helix domain-containing protein [Candidatus Doudnabacteria bacterium]